MPGKARFTRFWFLAKTREQHWKSAATVFIVTGIGAAYLILSMMLVINIPPLHFLWIIATFFFAFYAISTLTSYLAAVAFVNTISLGIPLWDRHVSAETNVEDTLWLLLGGIDRGRGYGGRGTGVCTTTARR